MLTPDARFEGWTADDWMRFLHLWQPRATPEHEKERSRGGIIALHDTRRVRKLLHTGQGRIEVPKTRWPIPLSELARDHHASWALSAHVGALGHVMPRVGARGLVARARSRRSRRSTSTAIAREDDRRRARSTTGRGASAVSRRRAKWHGSQGDGRDLPCGERASRSACSRTESCGPPSSRAVAS